MLEHTTVHCTVPYVTSLWGVASTLSLSRGMEHACRRHGKSKLGYLRHGAY